MSALTFVASRALRRAAMRRIAASSVASVPSRYERSLRPRAARISRAQGTICPGGQR